MRERKKEVVGKRLLIDLIIFIFLSLFSMGKVNAINYCSQNYLQILLQPQNINLNHYNFYINDTDPNCNDEGDPYTCWYGFDNVSLEGSDGLAITPPSSLLQEKFITGFSATASSSREYTITATFSDNDIDGGNNCFIQTIVTFMFSNPTCTPGAIEQCNGIDDNCNGIPDEEDIPIENSIPYWEDNICTITQTSCNHNYWYYPHLVAPDGPLSCPPRASITYPHDGDFFYVGTDILFESDSPEGYPWYLWTFNDNNDDYADPCSNQRVCSHRYNMATNPIVVFGVGLESNNGGIETDSASITIHVGNCNGNDGHCGSIAPLCCNYECKNPDCIEDSDCDPSNPNLIGVCNNPNSCESSCSIIYCPIACTSDGDCEDSDLNTRDICENPGTCDSNCSFTPFDSPILDLPQEQEGEENETEPEIEPSNNDSSYFAPPNQAQNNLNLDAQTPLIQKTNSTVQELGVEQVKTALKLLFNSSNFKIKRTVKVVNLTTIISLNITSDVPIGFKDVVLREQIPKDVVSNTNLLSGDFNIINEDPEIEFIIPKFVAGSEVEVSYVINQVVNGNDAEKIVASIIGGTPNQDELDLFLKQQQLTSDETIITKKVTIEDNKTIVLQTVSPKKNLKDVDLYLSIPKCMAEKLNDLYFSNKNYHIIADDPMVVWHFDEIKEEVDLSYEVFKEITDKDCQNQAVIIAVAKEIEGSIINKKSFFSSNIFLVLLVIPLIAFIFISTKRFVKIDTLKDEVNKYESVAVANLKHIAAYIDKEYSKGMDAKQIVKNLKVVGWTEDLIKASIVEVKDENAKTAIKIHFEND